MNTKVLVGVIVIIIIGAGAYLLWGKGGTGGSYGPTTNVPIGGGSSSLQSLVAAGSPVTCTFSTTTASGSQNGTIYIANGMVAGDFTSVDPRGSGSVNAHMIVRDQTSYVWTSASNQGFKGTVAARGSLGQSPGGGLDYSAQMDYSCQAWNADTSKFNLPANISFVSTASFTPPAQGAGATGASTGVQGTAAQCAQCNSLPSAQKAQCLAALSCK